MLTWTVPNRRVSTMTGRYVYVNCYLVLAAVLQPTHKEQETSHYHRLPSDSAA